ncbi:bile acid:sodium symporter family protein [Alloalcanivorax gelatiniphagus]|uniref:Bile acid:sodium symporter family protein n=1 Tax=Alloalcanivorax gelatiniphagus TaxID=1194167 RepID=A0ABY2XK79_9GAMM|nr:bile acid:sodium symporter [Alloalcanivorax gelatiniphagus]TMW11888.1 bile acid:sodium symporter family protein [Alloalcanivorax gelatiniphagus]
MDQAALISVGLPAALFLIMVGMGLTLTPRDFREVLVAPRATLFGLVAQILLLPLVGVGLAVSLDLSPALAVGLVIIAACPGGTTSNLFAFLGRGDVALSIVLTVAASLITIVTLPMFTSWALGHFQDSSQVLELPVLRTILTLLVIILIPVAIGMTIRHFKRHWAEKGEKLVSVFGLLVLGMVGGRLIGLSRPQAFTVAIELGIKNGTLGLMVTLTLLHSDAMSVPAAVYGVLMFLFGFLMIGYGRLTGLGRS